MKLDHYYQSGRYKNNSSLKRSRYLKGRVDWIEKQLSSNFFGRILDVGCGDGSLLWHLKRTNKNLKLSGVDISKEGCLLAKKKGISAKVADLNEGFPFPKNYADFVIAHEIIEHLVNPDAFFKECSRVLKKGGHLIIMTPNLVAWYNRILFIFGVPPLFLEMSTLDRRVGIGVLRYIIKNIQPVGHLRIFTLSGLKDLANLYGFEIQKIKGSALRITLPCIVNQFFWIFDHFFSFFPPLSSDLLVVLKKA